MKTTRFMGFVCIAGLLLTGCSQPVSSLRDEALGSSSSPAVASVQAVEESSAPEVVESAPASTAPEELVPLEGLVYTVPEYWVLLSQSPDSHRYAIDGRSTFYVQALTDFNGEPFGADPLNEFAEGYRQLEGLVLYEKQHDMYEGMPWVIVTLTVEQDLDYIPEVEKTVSYLVAGVYANGRIYDFCLITAWDGEAYEQELAEVLETVAISPV